MNVATACVAVGEPGGEALDDAAEALREAEIAAVQANGADADPSRLESMSIDELRKLAARLAVPDRGQIVEQDKLIAAIRERM
jgi:hypothetical protein